MPLTNRFLARVALTCDLTCCLHTAQNLHNQPYRSHEMVLIGIDCIDTFASFMHAPGPWAFRLGKPSFCWEQSPQGPNLQHRL